MVVCIEFDKKLIGETETVTINVSIYSQISIAELFFQLREATLLKPKFLHMHAKRSFIVDLL